MDLRLFGLLTPLFPTRILPRKNCSSIVQFLVLLILWSRRLKFLFSLFSFYLPGKSSFFLLMLFKSFLTDESMTAHTG